MDSYGYAYISEKDAVSGSGRGFEVGEDSLISVQNTTQWIIKHPLYIQDIFKGPNSI